MLQSRVAGTPHITASTGIVVIIIATIPVLWLFYAMFGPLPAWAVGALVVLALGMTIIAQRNQDTLSTDPETGLPDREAAIDRLIGLMDRAANPNRQAAIIVIQFEGKASLSDRRQVILAAAVRLSQVLRQGDQIVHIADNRLAAILGHSRGLDRDAIQSVMQRLEAVLNQPIQIDIASFAPKITIGGCGQCDAPASDAWSWLDAAEMAAEAAGNARTAVLFVPGNPQISFRHTHLPPRNRGTDEDSFGLEAQTSPIHP